MPDAALTALKAQFRRDVDDVDLDPSDQAGLLWSDDDVLHYINVAQSEFVRETRYRSAVLEIPVVATQQTATFSESVIETKTDRGYLVTAERQVYEKNHEEAFVQDDYGLQTQADPFFGSETGTPRLFTLDLESGVIRFYPVPDANDTLKLAVWLEATELVDWDSSLDITNPRHRRMLLAGMKREAYRKHDADTFDMGKANYWDAVFQRHINQVAGDRERRETRPQAMPYGGIP